MVNRTVISRKLLEDTLSGKKTDVIPVALWRHFPIDDQEPESLAAATISFQNLYKFDLIKVSPSSSFCLKDWGAKDEWKGNPEGSRDYEGFVIHKPEDWLELPMLNPAVGKLGEQIRCLELITREFSKTTPVLQTIFSPLSQAKNLAGKNNLTTWMRQYPDALHSALQIITNTTIEFIRTSTKTGIDGIFYSFQHARYELLTPDEFEEFQKAYDLQVLNACRSLWLNMAHIHGEGLMFDKILDYPVQILNWHDRSTLPSLAQGHKQFSGIVCGGLRQWETMAYGSSKDVCLEAEDAIHQTSGNRFILGTGCVTPIIAPHGNYMAAIQTAHRQNR